MCGFPVLDVDGQPQYIVHASFQASVGCWVGVRLCKMGQCVLNDSHVGAGEDRAGAPVCLFARCHGAKPHRRPTFLRLIPNRHKT